jgi:outer membrane protein assembly factor BamB
VYVPLSGGTIIALSAESGQLAWRADAGGELSTPPVVDDRNVYLATEYREGNSEQSPVRGALRAISKDTGVTRWLRTLSAPVRGSMASSSLRLFAGTADGRVYAFDKNNGLSVWITQYAQPLSIQPAVYGDRLYLNGDAETLVALDVANGNPLWRYRTQTPISSSVAVANGRVFFGSTDGSIYAVDEQRSKIIWRHRTGASAQSVMLVENGVVAASLDNFAYLLSPKNGAIIWRQLLPGRIASRPVTTPDGALFTPLSTDNAVVLRLKDGKPVNNLPLGEENSSSAAPVIGAKRLFITTPHFVLAFAPTQ